MVDYGDYDPPEFCNDTYPKARKEYTCEECRTAIKPGESYRRISGKWGGEFYCFKICQSCESLRAEVEARIGYGVAFGELFQMIAEYESELSALLVIAHAAS